MAENIYKKFIFVALKIPRMHNVLKLLYLMLLFN